MTTTTLEHSSNGCFNKIYPILDILNNNKHLDIASNCSDLSSESQQNFPPNSSLKSTFICNSLYDSFGSAKSDGEAVCFSGWVQVLPQGIIKHRKRGWAVIRNDLFTISLNEESASPFFGPFDIGKCIYLGKIIGNNNSEEICLIFNNNSNKKNNKPLKDDSNTFITLRFIPEENNGKYWLPLLAKSSSPRNDLLGDSLSLLDCCGKLYIKQGISGLWNDGWAFITERTLHYWVIGPNVLTQVDIRKIIFIQRKDIHISDWCNKIEHSTLGPILISLEGSSLYLQSYNDCCTTIWFDILTSELRKEPNNLEDCRLTLDDVPIIVDKCIRYISTYGLYQQGIYRKNGSTAELKKIIASFREDPHAVHLKPPTCDETVFVVASVLRTFFRQLNKPLIPLNLHTKLYEISNLESSKKPQFYRQLIFSLPQIYFKTLRKLLGHLQEIISHENRNLASLDNISKMFGPTLFTVASSNEEISVDSYTWATKQTFVMRDLIFHYCEIFGVSVDELLTKCKLDLMQEQKSTKHPAAGKQVLIHWKICLSENKLFSLSGIRTSLHCTINQRFVPLHQNDFLLDLLHSLPGFNLSFTINNCLLIPIHLFEKDNKCFNIQSEWTASQVVAFKINKLATTTEGSTSSNNNNYALFEMIRKGQLERRIGANESIKSIVLGRWLEWEEFQDNYLLLKNDSNPFQPQSGRAFADDLKISEPNSKSFKSSSLRIEEGTRVCLYSKNLKKLNEWKVDEMIWFIGAEIERKCPFPFALTFFVSTEKRAAKCLGKLPGYCVAFKDEVQRHQWLNCICLNQSEYLPQPLIQI
uniref:Rho-GAP domain-containing protein n=1 Tax=Meloidogyne incognita TaxID=6306 RepID=A0A914MY89_MELIC